MIKKVKVSELIPGMYIHDLNCTWLSHPFLLSHFKLQTKREIKQIRQHGIAEVYIDTDLGLDIRSPSKTAKTIVSLENKIKSLSAKQPVLS
jgi:hypothetical protein